MKHKNPSKKKNKPTKRNFNILGTTENPRKPEITNNRTSNETSKPEKWKSAKSILSLFAVIIGLITLAVDYKQLEHAWNTSEPAIGAKHIRLTNFEVGKMFQVELTLENTGNSTAHNVQALSSLSIRLGSQLRGYPITNPSTGSLGAKNTMVVRMQGPTLTKPTLDALRDGKSEMIASVKVVFDSSPPRCFVMNSSPRPIE